MKSSIAVLAALLLFGGTVEADQSVDVLILLARNFGANSFIVRDKMEEFGWNITIAGLTQTVQPCPSYAAPLGAQPLTVDVLVQDVQNVGDYDCLLIVSASVFAGDPFADVLASQEALDLVWSAVEENVVVAAWCAGVRVLAAADVLDGRNVTGHPNYQAEYEAAGATYLGPRIPPVTDGNIVTCTRGQYYNIQNCDAVAAALETVQSGLRRRGEER